jgi:hypothetical protein
MAKKQIGAMRNIKESCPLQSAIQLLKRSRLRIRKFRDA